ncbi:MAG TPA: DUF5683 domain-containing protein [Tangfeifania sp.]|nr:DUF5683 domain-containing protein [Tangfeifania sp.]
MNIRKYLLIAGILLIQLIVVSNLQAQQIVEGDTLKPVNKKPVTEEGVHSPRKAAIYSAILPGLGQAYNKKYWKIPLVYIGFGAIGYFIDWNNDNYQLMRRGYRHWTDGNDETTAYLKIESIRKRNYDINDPTDFSHVKDALQKQQDYYRRNRDLLIISFVGFYGLNIIDASVDAHLFNFDIGDDLTFKWEPSMQNVNDNFVYCFNLKFNF